MLFLPSHNYFGPVSEHGSLNSIRTASQWPNYRQVPRSTYVSHGQRVPTRDITEVLRFADTNYGGVRERVQGRFC
jgi:hypothetical protein